MACLPSQRLINTRFWDWQAALSAQLLDSHPSSFGPKNLSSAWSNAPHDLWRIPRREDSLVSWWNRWAPWCEAPNPAVYCWMSCAIFENVNRKPDFVAVSLEKLGQLIIINYTSRCSLSIPNSEIHNIFGPSKHQNYDCPDSCSIVLIQYINLS